MNKSSFWIGDKTLVISKTPLRASFFGGGTDFKNFYENTELGYGSTLSTTLNMYVYIMVNKRFDEKIRISYRIQELVNHVDEIQHNIIREALKIAGIKKGIDIVYSADIPISSSGVGLASSSAMAVGVLNALFAYQGKQLSPEQLAHYACKIEIEYLKNPIGIQDQYAVAYGGLKKYRFYPNEQVGVSPVIVNPKVMKKLEENLLLFYTGITRISSHILSEQKQKIDINMSILNEMVSMVDEAVSALSNGEVDEWGHMLDRAWKLKKQMSSQISNSHIEDMYIKAIKSGALGGKILGAGGGGFLMLYVPQIFQNRVREQLKGYREINFHFEREGSRIIFIE